MKHYINVNLPMVILVFFIVIYAEPRSDSLETVAKSGKWVVVSEKGRNGKKKNRYETHGEKYKED